MATMINPYLTFDGNCEKAFEFYRSVFGGELSNLTRFSEAPEDAGTDAADADRLMHVSLPLADGQVLMGSDRPSAMGPATPGDTISVSLSPASEEDARRLFEGLSEGGEVTMPFGEAFWGALFGMCRDRFGVHWMVDYELEQAG